MMATEGAEQPEWVKVQKRTFTNWINLQLSNREMKIENIDTDLVDGVNLINLVEVLSGKSVGKYRKFSQVSSGTATTKDRQLRMHFQHNIDKALKFLVNEEELKLVNVGAKDIVDQNESITLGLVWKLILRYHISQGATDKSAKKDLVAWIRSRIGPDTKYGLDIKNLTTDFQDGKALLALCDACSPGSMTDWNADIDPLERARRGMKTAKRTLKVPDILAAGDLGDDEFSVMAYLEYFKDLAPEVVASPEPERRPLGKQGSNAHVKLTW